MKPRILVVDDNLWIRRLLLTILERQSAQPVEAHDGVDAMEKIDQGPWDGIVLDLMMPRADGFEVIRFLREKHAELLPRTIVLTADSSRWSHADLGHVGKVIQKPFEMDVIVAVFKEVFGTGGEGAEQATKR